MCDVIRVIKKKQDQIDFPELQHFQPTFVGHLGTRLQVHLAASFGSDLIDLVAQVVTPVLSATQAEPFLEGFL